MKFLLISLIAILSFNTYASNGSCSVETEIWLKRADLKAEKMHELKRDLLSEIDEIGFREIKRYFQKNNELREFIISEARGLNSKSIEVTKKLLSSELSMRYRYCTNSIKDVIGSLKVAIEVSNTIDAEISGRATQLELIAAKKLIDTLSGIE